MLLCIKSYILLNLSFIKDNKEFNKLLHKLKVGKVCLLYGIIFTYSFLRYIFLM